MLTTEQAARYQTGEDYDEARRRAGFWRSLRKKVEHGPAVRIREGHEIRRQSGKRGSR